MDGPNDLRDFLTSRRARLTPQQAGLPDFGGRRRVPGLRREEVALLAGMSTEYTTSVSNVAARLDSPTPFSTVSAGPCNSTMPSARTSSTSCAAPRWG